MGGQPRTAAGVDVGGTFTDTVAVDPAGRVHARKVPTTTDDQSAGVVHGIEAAAGTPPPPRVAHGTTTATNAVLERQVARTTLVVTAGFADVLAIGRQDRSSLYDLAVTRPEPLVSAQRVVTADERLTAHGDALVPLTAAERDRVVAAVAATQPDSVAISLLFGFVDDVHERQLAAALRAVLDVPVTVASELLPEFREYERTATCALNAAVAPVMRRYLSRLATALGDTRVSVMTSGGGTTAVEVAAKAPVHTLLSGPAAGVVAAASLAHRVGYPDAVALDMGGTSTDVCLIANGEPQRRSSGEIGGLPLTTPATAVHTVGAGGGSLAWIDAGGALRVGPASAGAVPGPACYGRGGTRPTVTDAHAVLGHLAADASLASGSLTPDADTAHAAMATLGAAATPPRDGEPGRPEEAAPNAAGVLTVVRATMARALRRVSTEQGVDPAGLALVAYGGAGPLHACALARQLGCPAVLVPPAPGVASALGLLLAPPRAEASRTVMVTLARPAAAGGAPAAESDTDEAPAWLGRAWDALAAEAAGTLSRQGVAKPRLRWLADLRYAGQAHELRVEVGGDVDAGGLRQALHRAHADAYGYRLDDADVEVVTLRAVATGPPTLSAPPAEWDLGEGCHGPGRGERGDAGAWPATPVGLADGRCVSAAVVDRAALTAGDTVEGPALVRQPDATTLVEPGDQARVEAAGTLVVTIASRS